VRALSRLATPENEPRLLDLAYNGTAAHVERAKAVPSAAIASMSNRSVWIHPGAPSRWKSLTL